ncbi:hypothetical protein FHG87_024602 [Trinorchestia longiramus]|nr:hypothetical protein FHG87_024602 [Trinorchestia longiramus]
MDLVMPDRRPGLSKPAPAPEEGVPCRISSRVNHGGSGIRTRVFLLASGFAHQSTKLVIELWDPCIKSGTVPGAGDTAPGAGGTAPGASGTAPGAGGTAPGAAATAPGAAATAPGASGTAGVSSSCLPPASCCLFGALGVAAPASASSPPQPPPPPLEPLRYVTVLYGTLRFSTYGTIRYGTLLYVTVLYGTVRYGTVRYVTGQYGTCTEGTHTCVRRTVHLYIPPQVCLVGNTGVPGVGYNVAPRTGKQKPLEILAAENKHFYTAAAAPTSIQLLLLLQQPPLYSCCTHLYTAAAPTSIQLQHPPLYSCSKVAISSLHLRCSVSTLFSAVHSAMTTLL